jgi:hypothetical protein
VNAQPRERLALWIGAARDLPVIAKRRAQPQDPEAVPHEPALSDDILVKLLVAPTVHYCHLLRGAHGNRAPQVILGLDHVE